jgi:hypothetical protein
MLLHGVASDLPILLRSPNCQRAIAATLIPEQRHIA